MKDSILELRREIAHSVKCVRSSCFGRKCLKDCVRRMVAAAPHPRATRRRWGAAMAAVLLCFGAHAQVFCSWVEEYAGVPAHYECTGQGNYIHVNAADQVVVTNMFGGCTNCINVTPATCRDLRQQVRSLYDDMENTAIALTNGIDHVYSDISAQFDDIDSFRRFSDLPQSGTGGDLVSFTNYVFTVENSQTSLDRSVAPSTSTSTSRRYWVSYNNGIYDYANENVKPSLQRWKGELSTLSSYANDVLGLGKVMRDQVLDNLNCDACSDSSSGSCDCNESTGGKWCTEEQGNAIIRLLEDTKDYVEKLQLTVISISNGVQVAIQNLHDGFFTSYDHIPTEEELGKSWQELYLDGYSPSFHEYAKTNILARIELLLAGMSGVLTNNADFAEAGDFAERDVGYTNQVEHAIDGFTNDVAGVIRIREEKVRSVGDALVNLYTTFRGWSGTPFSRQTLINSYSVEIGANHWDVPSFEPSAQGVQVANIIRVVCRSVMSVFYILFTVVVFVRFHIAFFQWVLKYLKWAIELMQGLFA